VTRLAQVHPHLEIELLELEPHASVPALRVGDADIVITTTDFDELPLGPDLDLVPLSRDPVLLVLPADHPSAGQGPANLGPFVRITRRRGPGTHICVTSVANSPRLGFARPGDPHRVDANLRLAVARTRPRSARPGRHLVTAGLIQTKGPRI
jgi:DNA-binding transcriptional LysR family regulator